MPPDASVREPHVGDNVKHLASMRTSGTDPSGAWRGVDPIPLGILGLRRPVQATSRGHSASFHGGSPPVRPVRRFWAILAGASALVAVAMAATLASPLGFELWQYNVAFAVSLVGSALAWPLWRTRRFATLMLAANGALATATGAVMLYTVQFPYKEWVTWWHSVTSFVFTIAFVVHYVHNSERLLGFTRRLFTQMRSVGWSAASVWLVLLALGLWTATPAARAHFTSESYLPLSSWAILVGVASTYGAWLVFRAPRLRADLAVPAGRNRARAVVDTGLFLANVGALLTGFALLYFADFLRGGDLKYVSKWWHTATSVALLSLVTLHIGFNARLLGAHARRVDEDLTRAR